MRYHEFKKDKEQGTYAIQLDDGLLFSELEETVLFDSKLAAKDFIEENFLDDSEVVEVDVVNDLVERTLTDSELSKRETIVKKLKKHKSEFTDRYGKDGESVMYAVATNRAKMNEEVRPDKKWLKAEYDRIEKHPTMTHAQKTDAIRKAHRKNSSWENKGIQNMTKHMGTRKADLYDDVNQQEGSELDEEKGHRYTVFGTYGPVIKGPNQQARIKHFVHGDSPDHAKALAQKHLSKKFKDYKVEKVQEGFDGEGEILDEGDLSKVTDPKFRRVVGYSRRKGEGTFKAAAKIRQAQATEDPLQMRHVVLAIDGPETVQNWIKDVHAKYTYRKRNKVYEPIFNKEAFLNDLNTELNEEFELNEGDSYDNHYYVVGMIRNRHKAVLSGPHQFNDEQLRAHLHSTGDSYFKKHKGLTRLRALKGKDLVDHGFTQTYKKYMSVDESLEESTGTKSFRVRGSYEDASGNRAGITHYIKSAVNGDHAKDIAESKLRNKHKGYKAESASEMDGRQIMGDIVREDVEYIDEAWNPNEVHNMHTRLVSHGVAPTKLKNDHDYGKFSTSYHSHGSPEEHKKFTNRLLDNLIKHKFEPMTHAENGPSEFGARHWRHRNGMHVDIIHGKNGTEVSSYDNSYLKKMMESVNEERLVPFKTLKKGDTYSPVDPISKKPVWDDAKGSIKKHTLSQNPVPTHKGHWTSITTTGHRPIHHGDQQVVLHEEAEEIFEGAMSEIHSQLPKVYKDPELVHAETGKEGEKYAVVKSKLTGSGEHFHVFRYHPSHGWVRMKNTSKTLNHAKQRVIANINGGDLSEDKHPMAGGLHALVDKVSKKILAKGSKAEMMKKMKASGGATFLAYTYRVVGQPFGGAVVSEGSVVSYPILNSVTGKAQAAKERKVYYSKKNSALKKAAKSVKEDVERLDELKKSIYAEIARRVSDPEYEGRLSHDHVVAKARKEHGDKFADQVSDPQMKAHFGRPNRDYGYDKLAYRTKTRVTKDGKANKQDIRTLKDKIKTNEEVDLEEERKGNTPKKEAFSFSAVRNHLENAQKSSLAGEPAQVHSHLNKAHNLIKDHPKLGHLSKHIATIYDHNHNGAQHHVGQGLAFVKNAVNRADPDYLKEDVDLKKSLIDEDWATKLAAENRAKAKAAKVATPKVSKSRAVKTPRPIDVSNKQLHRALEDSVGGKFEHFESEPKHHLTKDGHAAVHLRVTHSYSKEDLGTDMEDTAETYNVTAVRKGGKYHIFHRP